MKNLLLATWMICIATLALAGGNSGGSTFVPFQSIPNQVGGCPAVGRYISNFLPGPNPPNFNATALTENTVYAVPVLVSCPITVNTINTIVAGTAGAAGSVIRFGLYGDAGNYSPGTLLEDCSTATATSTFAPVTVTCGSTITLTPGIYWCALSAQGQAGQQPVVSAEAGDSPGLSFAAASSGQGGGSSWAQTSVTGALPGTWAGNTNVSGDPNGLAPRCMLHRSA